MFVQASVGALDLHLVAANVSAAGRVGAAAPRFHVGRAHAVGHVMETLLGAGHVVIAEGVLTEHVNVGTDRGLFGQLFPQGLVGALHLVHGLARSTLQLLARALGQEVGPSTPVFLGHAGGHVVQAGLKALHGGLTVLGPDAAMAGRVEASLSHLWVVLNQAEGLEAFIHAGEPLLVGAGRE